MNTTANVLMDASNFHTQTQTTQIDPHNQHSLHTHHQTSGGAGVDIPINNTTSSSIPVQTTSADGNWHQKILTRNYNILHKLFFYRFKN